MIVAHGLTLIGAAGSCFPWNHCIKASVFAFNTSTFSLRVIQWAEIFWHPPALFFWDFIIKFCNPCF